ncbi:MAG: ATP-dependent zinc metalloprotease FtsH [Ruminococcaceae bacterium]|nr:ATP-dependent zinc metalloprotease FtsH [Oscillospiraceae bacterium]
MNNKKGKVFYIVIGLVIIFLMNYFVFPFLFGSQTKEVSYDFFLEELDRKNIDEVEIDDTFIVFTTKTNAKNDKPSSLLGVDSNSKTTYKTGLMDDPALVAKLEHSGAKFTKVQPEEMSPILATILSYGIPILIMVIFWRFLSKQMAKGGFGGNAMSFGKSNAKVYVKAQTGKTFSDVAGQDEAKEALTEIVDFLHNPKKYAAIGATLPKGALLVGPPGTGKTLLAQAVAGEANVPFFSISGSEFVEMFVGMGAAKVRDLFKQANEKAPCIVFIDEIDTIGKKRDSAHFSGGNDEREQTLNQLLTEMDGFDGKKGVVILAATNRPDSLDKALLRPGRFDRRIPVELPDLRGREAILRVHAKKVNIADGVDFKSIANATSGASGAELANIINESALRAVRLGRIEVEQSDLEESVEVILAGYQRKGMVISQKEKEIIAYHEVGHALVAALQKNSAPVHKITIIPRTSGALGYTMQVEEDEKFLMSKEEAFNKIVTFTAGRAAEKLMFNSVTTGASNDIEQATKIARAMITRYGMSDEFGMVAFETLNNPYLSEDTSLMCSNETSSKIDREVVKIISDAYEKAETILRNNMQKLNSIARYLIDKETITGDEFMDLLNM